MTYRRGIPTEVALLRCEEFLTHREIAERLGITEKTSKVYLSRFMSRPGMPADTKRGALSLLRWYWKLGGREIVNPAGANGVDQVRSIAPVLSADK